MLRPILLALLVFGACSVEPPPDLVIYRATPETLPDGEVRTRSMLITGTRNVLAVDRGPEGVLVRVGPAGGTYEDLRTALARARHLPVDTAANEPGVRTFQILAVMGGVKVRLTRDPQLRLERDVALAVEALEAIWESTGPAEDVVADTAPFLASRDSMIRGQAAVVLTQVWGDERAPAEVRAAAEKALRSHLEVEEERSIVHGIRDVIDQPDAE